MSNNLQAAKDELSQFELIDSGLPCQPRAETFLVFTCFERSIGPYQG